MSYEIDNNLGYLLPTTIKRVGLNVQKLMSTDELYCAIRKHSFIIWYLLNLNLQMECCFEIVHVCNAFILIVGEIYYFLCFDLWVGYIEMWTAVKIIHGNDHQ